MRSMRGIASALVVLVAIAAVFWQRQTAHDVRSSVPAATGRAQDRSSPESGDRTPTTESGGRAPGADAGTAMSHSWGRSVGFRSHERLVEHFRKHGREFGAVSQDEYLRRAQELRDRPAGGDVLESVRADGVITRFDRSSGAFLAVNQDGTIRTFFRPNLGETYFQRQLTRQH